MEDYKEVLNDSNDCPVFWLSLAITQWKLGRLQDEVKRNAIEIIENNVDLNRWEWGSDIIMKEKRRIVLEKLKEQLNTPQCPLKKVPKVFKQYTNFKIGDIVSYTYSTGEKVIFKTIWIYEHYKGDRYPIFEVYQWIGITVPHVEEIKSFPIAKWYSTSSFAVYMKNKKDYPENRLEIIGHSDFEVKAITGGYTLFNWSDLEKNLKNLFKLV